MRERLGLIGFGAFGRLTARHLSAGFDILAHDPAASDGEGLATLTDLATAAACPTVVLAVPVEARTWAMNRGDFTVAVRLRRFGSDQAGITSR